MKFQSTLVGAALLLAASVENYGASAFSPSSGLAVKQQFATSGSSLKVATEPDMMTETSVEGEQRRRKTRQVGYAEDYLLGIVPNQSK